MYYNHGVRKGCGLGPSSLHFAARKFCVFCCIEHTTQLLFVPRTEVVVYVNDIPSLDVFEEKGDRLQFSRIQGHRGRDGNY